MIPLLLTSEEVDAAMKQNARIPRSGLALAELLARHRIIERHAIEDADDYDGCATLDRIYAAHMEMISDNVKSVARRRWSVQSEANEGRYPPLPPLSCVCPAWAHTISGAALPLEAEGALS